MHSDVEGAKEGQGRCEGQPSWAQEREIQIRGLSLSHFGVTCCHVLSPGPALSAQRRSG